MTMQTWNELPPLTEERYALLSAFLRRILPNTRSHYRTRYNEFEFVHDAINRWIYMNFKFHVPPTDLCRAFDEQGYLILRTGQDDDTSPRPEEARNYPPYEAYAAAKLHISLHVPTIRMLRRYRTTLPERTQPSHIAAQRQFEAELDSFARDRTRQ